MLRFFFRIRPRCRNLATRLNAVPSNYSLGRLFLTFVLKPTKPKTACASTANTMPGYSTRQQSNICCWRSGRTLSDLIRSPNNRIFDVGLDPALSEQARLARARMQPETVVLSSTFTAEPVEAALQYWLDELEITAEVKFAPYNQVFQQLLDGGSELAANKRGLNVLLTRLQDWKSSSAPHEFVSAIQTAAARSGGAPILVCFCPPSRAVAGDKAQNARDTGD